MRSYRASSLALLALSALSSAALTLTPVGAASQWKRSEFRIGGVPTVSNPFDPDVVAVDATITTPSKRTLVVPAFWYQAYTRKQAKTGAETLTASGAPEWRLRFLPTESGKHTLVLTVKRPNQATLTLATSFGASASSPSGPVGVARVAASRQGFETTHGEALPLIGTNAPYALADGSYDYDRWLGKMAAAGQNYARVFMLPGNIGIEHDPAALTNYRLDQAWRLDDVLSVAESKGIEVQLCMDYALILNTVQGHYGIDALWNENPYNAANGGPCQTPDDFFTLAAAKKAYKKRLRYLVARYGASPKLFAWEFFDEMDESAPTIDTGHAADWLTEVGSWLKANDPYGHLVTTGLGNLETPQIWSLPVLDFVEASFYAAGNPAPIVGSTLAAMQARYLKPALDVMYAWNRPADPYLRGLRQSLWGAALGGGAGTTMPMNVWELDASDFYAPYARLKKALGATAWGSGSWTPVSFKTTDEAATLGDPIPGGTSFSVAVPLTEQWAAAVPGTLALPSADLAPRGSGQLPSYLLGAWFPTIQRPLKIVAWFGQNAKVTFHVDSVAEQAQLRVLVDGQEASSTAFPDKDGLNLVNEEYNVDLDVAVAPGKHTVEIQNAANGWVYLDYVGVTNALPARSLASPVAVGLKNAKETLAYVVAPSATFPLNATTKTIPNTAGAKLTLQNVAAGNYVATWVRANDGASLGSTSASASGGTLTLAVPSFSEDLFVRIVKK